MTMGLWIKKQCVNSLLKSILLSLSAQNTLAPTKKKKRIYTLTSSLTDWVLIWPEAFK